MKRDYRLYMDDILDAIIKISSYLEGFTFQQFKNDTKTVDAVIRNLEIVGEATKHVPWDIQKKYPLVPWRQMTLIRNKMIHEYFGVQLESVWETITRRLPHLKIQIEKVLEDMNREQR